MNNYLVQILERGSQMTSYIYVTVSVRGGWQGIEEEGAKCMYATCYRYSIYDIKRFTKLSLLSTFSIFSHFSHSHSKDALKFGKFYNIRYFVVVVCNYYI